MKQKAVLLVALVAAGLVAGILLKRSRPAMEKSAPETMAARTERQNPPMPAIIPGHPAPENHMIEKTAVALGKINGALPPPAQKNVKPKNSKPPLQDPTAREALSLVGADAGAEAYWITAIFDPGLPVQEREDLMEDLNEDGLSDPKHPGPEDLPLILNRLAIIEEVAPYADPFMQEHLMEAYKDLNNLLAGKPGQ